MHRSRPILPALAVLALILAACGDGTSPSEAASEAPPPSVAESQDSPPSDEPEPSIAAEPSEAAEDDFTVILNGFAFSTGQLVVPAGTEVTFQNDDTAAHTVTEGTGGQAADDPIINAQVGPGAVTRFTFEEPGTYEITCLLHSTINMTVVVEG
jgi:plastocyanin